MSSDEASNRFSTNGQAHVAPLFGAPQFLTDMGILHDFDYMPINSDVIESTGNTIRAPVDASPLPGSKSSDIIRIANFTSHVFRGFVSSTLKFRVEFKVESDATMLWLFNHKRLHATASLTSPSKWGEEGKFTTNYQFTGEKSSVKYRWYKDRGAKGHDMKSASGIRFGTKGSDDSSYSDTVQLEQSTFRIKEEQQGKEAVYMISVDVHQAFLRGQHATDDINLAMSSPLTSIEAVHLIVELKDAAENVFAAAASFPIYVTNFSFSVEERFASSPYVKRLEDSDCGNAVFAWYSKNGGDNASIDVAIHLRDSKGRFISNHNFPVPTNTQLTYVDGSPAPEMPLSPLKERRTAITSTNPLFRRLREDPVLLPRQGSAEFSFRVEEVSMHHLHKGGGGFRVKVLCEEPTLRYLVSPGVLDEIIIVRSKAKKGELGADKTLAFQQILGTLKENSPSPTILGAASDNKPTPVFSRKARKISVELPAPPLIPKENFSLQGETLANIPMHELFRGLYSEAGKCLWCGEVANQFTFVRQDAHGRSCTLASSFLATIQSLQPPLPAALHQTQVIIKQERDPRDEVSPGEEGRIKPPEDDIYFDFSVVDGFLEGGLDGVQTGSLPRKDSSNGVCQPSPSDFEPISISSYTIGDHAYMML